MATTYALPFDGAPTRAHGHVRSHNRKSLQERFSGQPILVGADPTRKETPAGNYYTHQPSQSHSDHLRAQSDLANSERQPIGAPLSATSHGGNGQINGGAKGMEHHVNMASLVSRPRGNSYGFSKANKDSTYSPVASKTVKAASRLALTCELYTLSVNCC